VQAAIEGTEAPMTVTAIRPEKTVRENGRREAEPPEVAQITETVVPF
jgi:hypothetical protein